jgi:predicted dehydrogenase
MANTLYDKGREAFLLGDIDWVADTIKVALIDTGTYTFSQAHDFLNDVSGVVGTAETLGTKTSTSGVADAADVTFTAVSGNSIEALILYKDTGNSATSPLIAYIDTATGLPVTPTGADITITWDSGASKIFKL